MSRDVLSIHLSEILKKEEANLKINFTILLHYFIPKNFDLLHDPYKSIIGALRNLLDAYFLLILPARFRKLSHDAV